MVPVVIVSLGCVMCIPWNNPDFAKSVRDLIVAMRIHLSAKTLW